MKKSYKIVLIISILLFLLSSVTSFVSYIVSLDSAKNQLKNHSLPLSVDNIYTDIQKHVIEPYLMASMMATDTFVKEWLEDKNKDEKKITNYLKAIETKYKKYNLYSSFIIDTKTNKYYKSKGLKKFLDKNNKNHLWYFNLLDNKKEHIIKFGFKTKLKGYNKIALFIDYKIYDKEYNVIGITGLSLEISYINEMLKKFRDKHMFNVYFFNKKGNIILSENSVKKVNIFTNKALLENKEIILSGKTTSLEYIKNNENFLLKTKYITELDLYLLVEAKVDNFVKKVKNTFYINFAISLLLTIIIAYLIIVQIRRHNERLEELANKDSLTKIANRRSFNESFEYFYNISQRNEQNLCILFIDLDNFKIINDSLGHDVGDEVLVRCAQIFKSALRKSDLLARWGGEEFVIALINTKKEDVNNIGLKILKKLSKDEVLNNLLTKPLTASIGHSTLEKADTPNTLLNRADKAMYKAKQTGKNKIVFE